MEHDAHGYWLREAGGAEPVASAAGDLDADVVVVGGGYAGMWTAWNLLDRGARVVLLEADVCGHGPSGRNGGFCETLWSNLPSLRDRFGDERALAACEASSDSVRAIGAWCEAEGVDAWFRPAGFLETSTSEAQDAVIEQILDAAAAVAPGKVVALDSEAVRKRCDSPRFRRGLLVLDDATLQPARLALGLRRRLLERGAALYERSRVRSLRADSGGVVAETRDARVRASAAVLTVNAATRGVRPLRSRLSVTSSHIVLTEPVPDVLESIGWTGGEAITDARIFLHYFRTTRDGRIAFGWGGGQLAVGARLNGRIEVDPRVVEEIRRHLVDYFPALERRAIRTRGAARSTSRPATCRRSARSTTARCTTRSASPATASARRTSPAACSPGWRLATTTAASPSTSPARRCRASPWPGSAGWPCAGRSSAPSGCRPRDVGPIRSRAPSAPRPGRSGSTCRVDLPGPALQRPGPSCHAAALPRPLGTRCSARSVLAARPAAK